MKRATFETGQINFATVTVVMDNKNILYRYHQRLFSNKYNNHKYTHSSSTIYTQWNSLYLYMKIFHAYTNYHLVDYQSFFKYFIFLLSLPGIDICEKGEITASSGRITSPWYPGKYPSNTKCTITIRLPLDTTITFTFVEMDIAFRGTYLTSFQVSRSQLR